ncbi:MAG: hypothetical protein AAB554_03970 [Patescibacteria group bacterium]
MATVYHGAMTYDDFLFYLPAFGSFALVGASIACSWLVWRLLQARKKKSEPVEKSPKT